MSRRTQKSQDPLSQRSRTLTQQTLEESFVELDLNVDDQVNNLVRYIVNRAAEHMSFKKNDLKKNVLPKAGQYYQEIIDKAAAILKTVYGYNMIIIGTGKNSKEYIISNALPYIDDPTESDEEKEDPKDVYKILLMLILSHIFMSNNSVGEVSLYAFLHSLKIDIERRHDLFGNIKDLINNTFKNKKYLNIEIDQMSKKILYSWGPRAEKEISKLDILKFVCKMYKDRLPNSWVNQYNATEQQCFENHRDELLLNDVQRLE